MARRPPDILITTPESLFLVLTARAREILTSVETVIVDEIHALAGTRADPGAEDLHGAWSELAGRSGAELLLCSAAAERRLPADLNRQPPPAYRLAGLATLLEWVRRCDRVVSF